MKILASVAFFFLSSFRLWSESKLQKFIFKLFGSKQHKSTLLIVFTIAIMAIMLCEYWILTGFFSLKLALTLLAALLLGNAIHLLIGAIAGFDSADKTEKLGALAGIWAGENPLIGCLFIIVGILMTLVLLGGSLIVFWSYPRGHIESKILIGIMIFTVPTLSAFILRIVILWPIITSAYVDDDFRNASLSSQVSALFLNTMLILFPFWVFQSEAYQLFVFLPPFWMLLSIPLVIFVFGSVFPFFVGLYRYKIEFSRMLEWRRVWLKALEQTLTIGDESARDISLEEKYHELETEIRSKFSSNELFLRFQQATSPEFEHAEWLSSEDSTANDGEPHEDDLPPPAQEVVTTDSKEKLYAMVRFAKKQLKPKEDKFTFTLEDVISNPDAIIQRYAHKMVDWDIRFDHLWRLLDICEKTILGNLESRIQFTKIRIGELDEIKTSKIKRKNIMAGGILFLISAGASMMFKNLEPQIIDFVSSIGAQ